MAQSQDAMTYRRRLRSELRALRKGKGVPQREVAASLDWSLSKLNRIESGQVGITTLDLKGLLEFYGVTDQAEIDRFVAMARSSRETPAWWNPYRHLISERLGKYLSYEGTASVLQQYHPLLVPGLLQEEEYARAVIRAYSGDASDKQVDELVNLRMERKDRLFAREDQPELYFVLDEAALRRWVGGPDVMREQLIQLRAMAQSGDVTIEIVPFEAGAHPGMRGPFILFEFSHDEDDIVYLEAAREESIIRDDAEEIDAYRDAFARLRELSGKSSLDAVIDRALQDMTG